MNKIDSSFTKIDIFTLYVKKSGQYLWKSHKYWPAHLPLCVLAVLGGSAAYGLFEIAVEIPRVAEAGGDGHFGSGSAAQQLLFGVGKTDLFQIPHHRHAAGVPEQASQITFIQVYAVGYLLQCHILGIVLFQIFFTCSTTAALP